MVKRGYTLPHFGDHRPDLEARTEETEATEATNEKDEAESEEEEEEDVLAAGPLKLGQQVRLMRVDSWRMWGFWEATICQS